MSRTIKGSKGSGFEYWGKRPDVGHYPPGRKAKQATHRIERRMGRQEVAAEARLKE